MCDDCFDEKYFPEDHAAYKKRLIVLEDGRSIDPILSSERDFEKVLDLTCYIETSNVFETKLCVDALFLFLEKISQIKIFPFRLYDGEIVEVMNLTYEEIKENLYLECEDKGIFHNDNVCVSQSFTDKKSFYAIVQKGIIFFSGNDEVSKLMESVLKELNIGYSIRTLSKNDGQKD